jgi:hypothetical protein
MSLSATEFLRRMGTLSEGFERFVAARSNLVG